MTAKEYRKGIGFVTAAYLLWGVLPIFWKALASVPPQQILAHRILWSFVITSVLLHVLRRWPDFRATFKDRRNRLIIMLTAAIIGSNWFVYIWAVLHNRIVDASLGYFINPLVCVGLGVIFLGERLNRWQLTAFLLAAFGVGYMTIQYGRLPWISLYLAVSFGLYGLLRKTARVESVVGFAAETGMLSPLALIFLIIIQARGSGVVGQVPAAIHLLLLGSGVVTAAPMLWFTLGVRRISLSTAGFLQYIAPSLQLLLGVAVYGEAFTTTHLISFSFIWMALLIFSFSGNPRNPKRGKTI